MKKFFSCLIALVFLFSVFTFFNNINRITEQDESPGIKRDDYIVNTQMSNTAYVSCSNNYVYSTGGTETKHCPCELAIHPSHVHSYSGHNCVTCNTYTPAHDYTFNYVQKDGAQHTAYCVCGASKAEDHTYSESYLWLDGYSHRAYCECGAATKRGHAVASGAKPPYTCIFCNGSAQAGITEYSLSIPIGATQITENGSYVLPNGITIVAEADLEDFLNGTPKLLKHNLVLSA